MALTAIIFACFLASAYAGRDEYCQAMYPNSQDVKSSDETDCTYNCLSGQIKLNRAVFEVKNGDPCGEEKECWNRQCYSTTDNGYQECKKAVGGELLEIKDSFCADSCMIRGFLGIKKTAKKISKNEGLDCTRWFPHLTKATCVRGDCVQGMIIF